MKPKDIYELEMKVASISGMSGRLSGFSDWLHDNANDWVHSNRGMARVRREVKNIKALHEEIGNELFQLVDLLEQSKNKTKQNERQR